MTRVQGVPVGLRDGFGSLPGGGHRVIKTQRCAIVCNFAFTIFFSTQLKNHWYTPVVVDNEYERKLVPIVRTTNSSNRGYYRFREPGKHFCNFLSIVQIYHKRFARIR